MKFLRGNKRTISTYFVKHNEDVKGIRGKMDVIREIENIKLELEAIKATQNALKVGYAETTLNLALCRGIALVLSALNFLQIGIK